MDNKRKEQLCLGLLSSERESDIEVLLKKEGLWEDSSAWETYGGMENNFAIIGNQKESPADALVEKLVNSVDAVLTREALVRNMDPESEKAPKTIGNALEMFFQIKNGNLANVEARKRTKLAANIGLVATGRKGTPNFTIFDLGEGQSPDNFSKTFLSLAKSNKLKIPFVQGKFNQGGTAVLRFCGRRKLQLLVSKRHPELEDDGDWGFTIVRREAPGNGRKHSMYTYLAPNGKILSFKKNQIEIPTDFPGTQEIEPLKWGTIIKLYEYELAPALKTNILFDLFNKISLLLPRIGLPIRFYERRDYKGHTLESTMSGLGVRLQDDKRKNLEEGFPSIEDFTGGGERFQASIFAFKDGQSEKYRDKEGIIFTVNGQTHGFIPDTFFSRPKSVQMGYLRNSLLLLVNCDHVNELAIENLFMNSRDRLSRGELRNSIERELERIVRTHKGLKELREKRRREALDSKLADSRPLQDVLSEILKHSPGLEALFLHGAAIKNPFKSRLAKQTNKFKGKKFPTYFSLSKGQEKKQCHINQRFRVQFETDANNNYLGRDRYPGTYSLKLNGEDANEENYVLNLWQGIGTLNVNLPPGTKEGDTIACELMVSDDTQLKPFISKFAREVLGPANKSKGGEGRRRQAGKDGKGTRKLPDSLAMPHVVEVREREWSKHGFDKFSSLKVIQAAEKTYDFFINMDNVYLRTEQKRISDPEKAKLSGARFKYGNVLIGLTLLRDRKEFGGATSGNGINEIAPEDLVTEVSKSLAPALLPMIDVLGDLNFDQVDDS